MTNYGFKVRIITQKLCIVLLKRWTGRSPNCDYPHIWTLDLFHKLIITELNAFEKITFVKILHGLLFIFF